MFAIELDELPTERLEAEITRLYSRISAEMCRWLLLVGEYDRREAYLEWGCRSTAHWLSWHCGIGLRTAYEHVRVGRALAERELIRDAYSRGELSYSKVRALTRIASDENEADLLELARNASGAQLERVASHYQRALAPEDLDALRERRDLTHFDDGMFGLHARLTSEEGELIRVALEHAAERIERECRGKALEAERGARRPSIRWGELRADALLRMAEVYMAAAATADSSGGDRNQVVVHVDAEALASAESAPAESLRCELESGRGVHPETARRLACDAAVVALSERDGKPLSVGRKTRTIPPAIRRALRARDGCCTFPGCTAKRFLDAHHVRHWAHGGETSLANLVSLCRYHHRLVHEGRFTVEMRRAGPVFRRPSGAEVPHVPKPAPPRPRLVKPEAIRIPSPPLGPDGRHEPPLAPCSARFGGEPMDLDHTLLVLLHDLRMARARKPAKRREAGEQRPEGSGGPAAPT